MKEAGLPEPKFDTHGFFTVTFMKRAKINSVKNGTLNGTERLVFDCIKATPGITANAIIQQSNKSIRTIRRTVKQLIDNGLIEYRGSKKTGGYYIND